MLSLKSEISNLKSERSDLGWRHDSLCPDSRNATVRHNGPAVARNPQGHDGSDGPTLAPAHAASALCTERSRSLSLPAPVKGSPRKKGTRSEEQPRRLSHGRSSCRHGLSDVHRSTPAERHTTRHDSNLRTTIQAGDARDTVHARSATSTESTTDRSGNYKAA